MACDKCAFAELDEKISDKVRFGNGLVVAI
jgi:hypothetical protein